MTKHETNIEAETETPSPAVDPTQTGINHLRAADPAAMRLWSVKGPKAQAASTIAAVLMDQDTAPRVVLMQQFENGKFVVFERAPS